MDNGTATKGVSGREVLRVVDKSSPILYDHIELIDF